MILRFTRRPDGLSHRLTVETDLGEPLISESISAGKMLELGQYVQLQASHLTPPSLTIETAKTVQAFERMIDGSFREA